jgi:phosphoribosyl-ATP pyrophosphohydrolase/phosphoribosyl-AMP cyclohydrolase
MNFKNFKNFADLAFDASGLIPAVAQDAESREVLMLAYMNQESLRKTIETGKAHYYSRSRNRLWLKGETSGHFQHVREILRDCDDDALLLLVDQTGAACHTGNRTCFHRSLDGIFVEEVEENKENGTGDSGIETAGGDENVLHLLQKVIENRRAHPKEGSYTRYLFEKGIDKMLKKVGEESAEVIIAAKNPNPQELVYETADLIFHLSVVLVERNLSWRRIFDELERRRN